MDCIPISGKREAFTSGEVTFSSGKFFIESPTDAADAIVRIHGATERGDIVPVLDVDSFSRRYLNPDVVKEIKIKGRRIWLISYIRSADDVIDAMCGAFDRLCVPFHTIDDPDVLSEALELSDCILPTIFVSDGRYIEDGDISEIVTEIRDLGYYEYAVFDVNGCTLEYHAPFMDPIN